MLFPSMEHMVFANHRRASALHPEDQIAPWIASRTHPTTPPPPFTQPLNWIGSGRDSMVQTLNSPVSSAGAERGRTPRWRLLTVMSKQVSSALPPLPPHHTSWLLLGVHMELCLCCFLSYVIWRVCVTPFSPNTDFIWKASLNQWGLWLPLFKVVH